MDNQKISAANVQHILTYAKINFPHADVVITGQDKTGAADSIYIGTNELTIMEAHKLMDFRRSLSCHIGIGANDQKEAVMFDMQFPFPHPHNL